ncbi:MAG: acetylserotonin O-methyltransferase [Thermoplasmata archaeon]|nr:acetylserotonin O-methyltransferase [Thermoplasmata archaeon]
MTGSERPPSRERILDMMNAFQRSSVLRASIELDVFSLVGAGTVDLGAIANAIGAPERGVRALLNYLVTLELLSVEGTKYALTPESARYLDRRSPAYLGSAAEFYDSPTMTAGFAASAEAVRRGGGGAGGTGSMAPNHPLWIAYARAMTPLFARPAESFAELVAREAPRTRQILDVAAGHGLFGIAVGRRLPQAQVTALDWPAVLPVAAGHARDAGIADRFSTTPGSAFDLPLERGWDLVVLANFLHHFDVPACERLLRRVHHAMAAEGTIAVVEFIPNEDRVSPPSVAQFAMTMLTTTPGGDVYTFSELAGMLERAGFQSPTAHPLAHTPQRVVLARRAAAERPRSGL